MVTLTSQPGDRLVGRGREAVGELHLDLGGGGVVALVGDADVEAGVGAGGAGVRLQRHVGLRGGGERRARGRRSPGGRVLSMAVAHLIGTVKRVSYSSKSETRSVTAIVQSPATERLAPSTT